MGGAFDDAMRTVLASIPPGRVATCGALARALGDVRAARAVALWVLEHPDADGGTRVVRADGRPILRGGASSSRGAGLVLGGRAPAGHVVDILPDQGLLRTLRREQEELASEVSEQDGVAAIRDLGGVDVSYEGDRAFAVALRCDAHDLKPIEVARARLDVDFPYVPTYLAFREYPLVEAVVRRLRRLPDVLLVDGHGQLHPALFGFACFAGVRLGIPTVGVAKHPLCGTPRADPTREDGAVPILLEGAVRGFAWRPARASRPIYVSVGHRLSLPTALRLVQGATRDRSPEPLRIADALSKEMKRAKSGEKGVRSDLANRE